MATMDVSEVTVGSALATGAIWVAPKGTTLPTDASTTLGGTWKLLGFTSDAGVTISENGSSQSIVAWEGRTEVYNVRTEYTESIAFTPIQTNSDVLKVTYGDDQVTVSGNKITVKHTGKTLEPICVVIETVPRDNIVKRYCGTFQLVERGEQTLDGTQIDGRQLTFNAVPDSDGVTMYEFVSITPSGATS